MSENYTLHYKRFHPDTVEHKNSMVHCLSSVLAPLISKSADHKALDIGCGFGFAMLALKALGINDVKGVDVSQAQVEEARRRGLNAEFVQDTESYLNNSVKKYTIVLLMDVLEHVPVNQQISMLKSINGSLEKGGRLILTVPNANSPLGARRRYIDFTHYSAFTEHSLHYVLENAGYNSINILPTQIEKRPPLKIWNQNKRKALRRWIVRWCWLQVLRSEIESDQDGPFYFDPNLTATADKK